MTGPSGGTVRLPYSDRRFDDEAEFALVVGRRASHVTPEQALDHVLGHTGRMDITMRGGEDRSTRRSFDTFTPMGPWLVTPDELAPRGRSGADRQRSSAAEGQHP